MSGTPCTRHPQCLYIKYEDHEAHISHDEKLNCFGNELTALIVPEGVEVLNCSGNELTALIVPEGVKDLDCSYNKLTTLVVPGGVRKLYCFCNELTSLIVPQGVKELYCFCNKLTTLIVPQGVKELRCLHNKLTTLVVPEGVKELDCSDNKLTALIVPQGVEELGCYNNRLDSNSKAYYNSLEKRASLSLVSLCLNVVLRCKIKMVGVPQDIMDLSRKVLRCRECKNLMLEALCSLSINMHETKFYGVRTIECYRCERMCF